jgi:hypothetical protein
MAWLRVYAVRGPPPPRLDVTQQRCCPTWLHVLVAVQVLTALQGSIWECRLQVRYQHAW